MDVRESAFRRAAMLLSTVGAEYAIVYAGKVHTSGDCKFAMQTKDGTTHVQGLTLAVPDTKVKRNKVFNWKDTGYIEALVLIQPGDAWEYECPTKEFAEGFQKAVTGWASKTWGNGSYISTVKNGKTLEILRLQTELPM